MRGTKTAVRLTSRKTWRAQAKKLFKLNKYEDAEIGREINRHMTRFHALRRKAESGEEIDSAELKDTLERLAILRDPGQTPRFRHDFPTFRSFVAFLKKEQVTQEEIEEFVNEQLAV